MANEGLLRPPVRARNFDVDAYFESLGRLGTCDRGRHSEGCSQMPKSLAVVPVDAF